MFLTETALYSAEFSSALVLIKYDHFLELHHVVTRKSFIQLLSASQMLLLSISKGAFFLL